MAPMVKLPSNSDIDEKVSELTGTISYKLLANRRHPAYYEDFWARSRAFYKGGLHLLENDEVMKRVFPQHVDENDQVYKMRKNLAHYTNHSGAMVNHLLGKLFTDPVRVQSTPDADDFYTDFMKDCSPPGGKEEVSLNMMLGCVLLSAAQCQIGYALVEMPANLDPIQGEDGEMNVPMSLAAQEESGALDAWCVEVAPESVLDWETDKAGEYTWALLGFTSKSRPTVFVDRSTITEDYWMYNSQGWIRWQVQYKEGEKPKPETLIKLHSSGLHSFGKVPLARLCLPDGLWIMSKLESLAREYFNKRNALSWAEFRSLLPSLYEFIDPGTMPTLSGPGGDANKATNQTRSPRHVQQRQAAAGQGDRAEWIGPPDAPFGHALKSCDSVRDEMHRVVQQMALSADNKGATLRRSADSKKEDSNALDVVLGEYGKLGRQFVVQLLQLVEAGRGDEKREWSASGLSKFDSTSSDVLIEEETILDTIEMPSPTFKAERKKQIARKVLGDSVTEKMLAQIDQEIENFYSFESELEQAQLEAAQKQAQDQNGDDDEDDANDERDRSSSNGPRVIASSGTRRRQF